VSIFSDLPHFRNRAKGIVPTVSGWDTPPDNLQNVTDEDWNTSSGAGVTTIPGTGDFGFVYLDLGAVYDVMLLVKVGAWTDTSYVRCYTIFSQDGVNWLYSSLVPILDCMATSEEIKYGIAFIRARYVGLRFRGYTAMTANIKIYEIAAIDVSPSKS